MLREFHLNKLSKEEREGLGERGGGTGKGREEEEED
jgi:hypothetical protein